MENNLNADEKTPVVEEIPKDPVERMIQLLEKQNSLIERLVKDQDYIAHQEKLKKIWGTAKFIAGVLKHALWIGFVLWALWRAKMFFTNMFDAITPDFMAPKEWVSNAKDNVVDTTSGWADSLKGIFNDEEEEAFGPNSPVGPVQSY